MLITLRQRPTFHSLFIEACDGLASIIRAAIDTLTKDLISRVH